MRLGEIRNLKWISIYFKERILTVKNDDNFQTKSKRERIIPLSNKLLNLLKKRYRRFSPFNDEEYVFYKIKGVKYNSDFISKKFKKAIIKAEDLTYANCLRIPVILILYLTILLLTQK